jgi:hypothetical protein
MMVQASKNFVIAVSHHDGAQGQAHEQKRERLQAVEIVQAVPPDRGITLSQPGGMKNMKEEKAKCEKTIARPYPVLITCLRLPCAQKNDSELTRQPAPCSLFALWLGSRMKSLSFGVRDASCDK